MKVTGYVYACPFCEHFAHFLLTGISWRILFDDQVLPQHKEKDMKQTLIYIPDYFDFVRIRNYFKRETMSFAHINEWGDFCQSSYFLCYSFLEEESKIKLFLEKKYPTLWMSVNL